MPKPTVFITYSRADEAWKDRLAHHLRDHELAIWDDRHQGSDSDWLEQLEDAMSTAPAAVLLLSEGFLASPLIREVEVPFLNQRHGAGRLGIFPVLVNDCDWRAARWLDGLSVHSLDGEPLASGDRFRVEAVLRSLAREVAEHLHSPESTDIAPAPDDAGRLGRDQLFRRLFKDLYRPIFYFFSRKGFDREECRDLTQETFANANKGMGSYRNEASYKTWLFRIAKNLWLNRQRDLAAAKRNRAEVSRDEVREDQAAIDPPDADSLDPQEQLLQAERVRLVRDALAELPPQRRRCLILRLEGLKYREIAALLDISLQAVRSHLFQAREQLRGLLDEHFEDDGF